MTHKITERPRPISPFNVTVNGRQSSRFQRTPNKSEGHNGELALEQTDYGQQQLPKSRRH
jgi:hypothetical protein